MKGKILKGLVLAVSLLTLVIVPTVMLTGCGRGCGSTPSTPTISLSGDIVSWTGQGSNVSMNCVVTIEHHVRAQVGGLTFYAEVWPASGGSTSVNLGATFGSDALTWHTSPSFTGFGVSLPIAGDVAISVRAVSIGISSSGIRTRQSNWSNEVVWTESARQLPTPSNVEIAGNTVSWNATGGGSSRNYVVRAVVGGTTVYERISFGSGATRSLNLGSAWWRTEPTFSGGSSASLPTGNATISVRAQYDSGTTVTRASAWSSEVIWVR